MDTLVIDGYFRRRLSTLFLDSHTIDISKFTEIDMVAIYKNYTKLNLLTKTLKIKSRLYLHEFNSTFPDDWDFNFDLEFYSINTVNFGILPGYKKYDNKIIIIMDTDKKIVKKLIRIFYYHHIYMGYNDKGEEICGKTYYDQVLPILCIISSRIPRLGKKSKIQTIPLPLIKELKDFLGL